MLNQKDTDKLDIFNAVCWDYDINANDIYHILITKNDKNSPISFDTLRYKVLKYIPIDSIKSIFSSQEISSIFSDVNIKKVRNPQTKDFLNTLVAKKRSSTR